MLAVCVCMKNLCMYKKYRWCQIIINVELLFFYYGTYFNYVTGNVNIFFETQYRLLETRNLLNYEIY